MAKYIDADKLRVEIEALKERYGSIVAKNEVEQCYKGGRLIGYEDALDKINKLQGEQPEYGYFVTEFIFGKKSIFNVGDILAYYICVSNEEGEGNIGKVEKVEFDKEEGWLYTFENGDVYSEEELVDNNFYKKN